jgi:3'-5' exonuclease
MTNQNSYKPENLLLLDIETVPQYQSFNDLPELWKELWADRISKTMPEKNLPAEMYEQKAGIQAEFGKIICISTGFFYHDTGGRLCFRLKSYAQKEEKKLLKEFLHTLETAYEKNPMFQFAGHNIKEFDIPWICRRLLINQLPLPSFLQLSGKKPWETNMVDTMQLWKFGDYKNYSSLKVIAASLGIDTPKDDIDGSKVKDVYYKEKNLQRIVDYCQKDVVAAAQIILRFNNLPLLPQANIFVAES